MNKQRAPRGDSSPGIKWVCFLHSTSHHLILSSAFPYCFVLPSCARCHPFTVQMHGICFCVLFLCGMAHMSPAAVRIAAELEDLGFPFGGKARNRIARVLIHNKAETARCIAHLGDPWTWAGAVTRIEFPEAAWLQQRAAAERSVSHAPASSCPGGAAKADQDAVARPSRSRSPASDAVAAPNQVCLI